MLLVVWKIQSVSEVYLRLDHKNRGFFAMNSWSTCGVDRVVTDLVAVFTRLLLF